MPKAIAELAQTLLYKPERIAIKPAATPVECIEQGVYFAEKQAKRELLKVILKERNLPQTLVFTRTKHGADRVALMYTASEEQAEPDRRGQHFPFVIPPNCHISRTLKP